MFFRNKDGKLELDFDTDEHIQIADFLADDGEIPSTKVLHSQKMVPEFPGPEVEYSLQVSSQGLKGSRIALPQPCFVHDSQE